MQKRYCPCWILTRGQHHRGPIPSSGAVRFATTLRMYSRSSVQPVDRGVLTRVLIPAAWSKSAGRLFLWIHREMIFDLFRIQSCERLVGMLPLTVFACRGAMRFQPNICYHDRLMRLLCPNT